MEVESCSNEVVNHSAVSLIDGSGSWSASGPRASFIVKLSSPTRIENIFVRNAGSASVEVDGLCINKQWMCLLGTAQLVPPFDANVHDRLSKGRFFTKELSLPLKDSLFEKLRVTITSLDGSSQCGLAVFKINVTEQEREQLRQAGSLFCSSAKKMTLLLFDLCMFSITHLSN